MKKIKAWQKLLGVALISAPLFFGATKKANLEATVVEEVAVEEAAGVVTDAVTDLIIDAILPKAKGEFKGIKLGMAKSEVKSVIEKSKYLTPVESSLEGVDQAKTVMWDSEIWIRLFYDEERLFQIQFGTEKVSEDLIETKLRKQFADLYYYFYQKFGEPDYYRKGFSMKEITVSSFGKVPYTLIYSWINGNIERAIYLWKEDSKYCPLAFISNRKVTAEVLRKKK